VLLIAALLGLTLACTTAPTPPAAKDAGAAKPAGSPSPAAQATPTPLAQRPAVGGGAAQPRAAATFQAPGGNAIVVVPTPNFAVQATSVPAPLAPAAAVTTLQPQNVPQVTGTLSRIPTAIPGAGGGGAGGGGAGGGNAAAAAGAAGGGNAAAAAGAAAAVTGGGGGGGGAQTIPVVITATPLTRIAPQPQPTIAYPR